MIVPIYLNDDRSSRGNHRGLSLVSIICKLLADIISDDYLMPVRINPGPEPVGVLLVVVFLDLKSAFHLVSRPVL